MANSVSRGALWTLGVVAAGLMVVHSVRSEPAGVKTFATGDVLTAEDLNANFAAVRNGGTAGLPLVWSAFVPAAQGVGHIAADGRVATFTFSSPVDGFVFATASYEIRARNFYLESKQACRVESLLSDGTSFGNCVAGSTCNLVGYAQNTLNADLPTQGGGGAYFGLSQAASRVLPLKKGLNTFYLLGRTDCSDTFWGTVTITALQVQQNMGATLTLP